MRLFTPLLFLTFGWHLTCTAQVTITNNGVTITNLNKEIHVQGNIINQSSGYIQNSGHIYINGDITNNGTTSFSDSSSGTIHLTGSGQALNGTHQLNFHKLNLSMTDTLLLGQNIKVADSLVFTSGFIYLNGNTIDLDSTGSLKNERNNSRAFGSTGKITARKYLSSPTLSDNVSGMGIKIRSASNLGMTIIERGHTQQAAADSSIYRYFKISCSYPGNADSLSIAYFNDEKFGDENDYKVFTKKTSGNNGWVNRNGNVVLAAKEVAAPGPMLLDTLFITAADEKCLIVPDIHVSGITSLTAGMAVDTITCTNDTVSVNAWSTDTNAIIQWRDLAGNIYSNPLSASAIDFYFIDIADGQTGCKNSILVSITQDKIPPLLDPLPDSLFLNCSQSTILLDANSPTSSTTLQWTGTSLNAPDPASANTIGNYIVTATGTSNGCSRKDSVYVGFKPFIVLTGAEDTTVCKNSVVTLSVTATGNLTGVTYAWNTGGQTPSINVQPASTTSYVVTANSPGCSGKDTIVVTIPPDLVDSVATYRPCNDSTVGKILVYAYGGIPPYLFSIDNGVSYSANGNFSGVPFGTYSIIIKDSIGCTKSNTATLSSSSSKSIPQFIASTQNMEGDTVVLVDISTPQPDSVSWLFPAQASIVGGDMFSPIIYMPNTGAFSVTMTSYWSDCVLDTTKLIYFHPFDSTFATEYNNNGIKSVSLYPNPSSGNFTVAVEFYKKQNCSIQIWDSSPAKYYQKDFMGVNSVTQPITLAQLVNGSYILRVTGEYNSKHVNFVITQ